jgi:hypothetical protein
MSYEAYYQYICSSGHYWISDIEEDAFLIGKWERTEREDDHICPDCNTRAFWKHGIDITNGLGEAEEVVQIGEVDVEHRDHYGNKYYKKLKSFMPSDPNKWQKLFN